MSTSEKGHYTRFDEALLGEQDFCDTGMLRRGLSNLDHLADQYAQTLVKWVAPTGKSASPPIEASDEMGANIFKRVWTSTPFDLPVRSSTGESYRCRLRARIADIDASGAGDEFATFRFVLAPIGLSEAELQSDGVNVKTLSVFENEGAVWKTPADLIYLDAALTRRAKQRVSAIDSIGGSAISATWLRAHLVVWAASSDGLTVWPALTGVDLCAYLHP